MTIPEKLLEYMKNLSFVQWDRFVFDRDEFFIYGWIDRQFDFHKKDFVLLVGDADDLKYHITSSARMDKEIAEVLYGDRANLEACKRVEEHLGGFKIKNVIKI